MRNTPQDLCIFSFLPVFAGAYESRRLAKTHPHSLGLDLLTHVCQLDGFD